MENAIIIVVLIAIIGGAVAYIIKAKKNGVKCIGCSAGGCCGANKGEVSCNGCHSCSNEGCGCGCQEETK